MSKLPKHTSWSQLSSYTRCGEQFRLRYIEGIRTPPSSALYIGTGVHEGARVNGVQKIDSHQDLPAQQIVDSAVEGVKERVREEGDRCDRPFEEKGDTTTLLGECVDETARLAAVYAEQIAPKSQPTAVEVEFSIPITIGGQQSRPIIGFIDTEEVDGLTDLKTSASKMDDGLRPSIKGSRTAPKVPKAGGNAADKSDQLTIYALAYFLRHGSLPPHVRFDGIIKTKTPYVQRIESFRTEEDFNGVLAKVEQMERGIAAGIFMPTTSPQICSPQACSHWGHCKYVRNVLK